MPPAFLFLLLPLRNVTFCRYGRESKVCTLGRILQIGQFSFEANLQKSNHCASHKEVSISIGKLAVFQAVKKVNSGQEHNREEIFEKKPIFPGNCLEELPQIRVTFLKEIIELGKDGLDFLVYFIFTLVLTSHLAKSLSDCQRPSPKFDSSICPIFFDPDPSLSSLPQRATFFAPFPFCKRHVVIAKKLDREQLENNFLQNFME